MYPLFHLFCALLTSTAHLWCKNSTILSKLRFSLHARHYKSVRQNHVYNHQFGNALKYTLEKGMVSALHRLWVLWLKQANLWYMCVSQWRRVFQDESFKHFFWNKFFKDNTGSHMCVSIVPQPMYLRLDFALAIRYEVYNWHVMGTGRSMSQ